MAGEAHRFQQGSQIIPSFRDDNDVETAIFTYRTFFKLFGTLLVPLRFRFFGISSSIGNSMSGDKKTAFEPSRSSGRFDQTELPDKIGSSLRKIYDDVLNEDVPDDFLDILKSADDRPAKSDRDASK